MDGKKGGKKRPPLERALVLFIVLVVKLLQCPRYKPGCAVRLEDSHAAVAAALAKGDASETPTPAVMTAVGLVTRMFSQAMLTQICQVMVGEYFMMSAEEAEEWADSPEEYVFEEAGDAWMFSLRPCTVCLYVELIKQYVGDDEKKKDLPLDYYTNQHLGHLRTLMGCPPPPLPPRQCLSRVGSQPKPSIHADVNALYMLYYERHHPAHLSGTRRG